MQRNFVEERLRSYLLSNASCLQEAVLHTQYFMRKDSVRFKIGDSAVLVDQDCIITIK